MPSRALTIIYSEYIYYIRIFIPYYLFIRCNGITILSERGWCGRIKKERPVHSFFRPIDTSAESLLPQLSVEGSTSPYFLPNHSFFVTWRQKKIGYCKGTVVLHRQYPARITSDCSYRNQIRHFRQQAIAVQIDDYAAYWGRDEVL